MSSAEEQTIRLTPNWIFCASSPEVRTLDKVNADRRIPRPQIGDGSTRNVPAERSPVGSLAVSFKLVSAQAAASRRRCGAPPKVAVPRRMVARSRAEY